MQDLAHVPKESRVETEMSWLLHYDHKINVSYLAYIVGMSSWTLYMHNRDTIDVLTRESIKYTNDKIGLQLVALRTENPLAS